MTSSSESQGSDINQSGSLGIGVNQGEIEVESLSGTDQRGQIVDRQLNFTNCIIQVSSEEFVENDRSRRAILRDKQHFQERLETWLEVLAVLPILSPRSLNTLENELEIWTQETTCPVNQELLAKLYSLLAEEYTVHAYEGIQSKLKAIKLLDRGELLCKESKANTVLCEILNQRGIAFHNMKNRDFAVKNFQEMNHLSKSLGNMQRLSKSLIDQSFTESYSGNSILGESLAREAKFIGLAENDQNLIFNAKLALIAAYTFQNKRDTSLKELTESLALYRNHDEINPMWYIIHQIFHGIVLLQTGEGDESLKHLEVASRISYKQQFLGMADLSNSLRQCQNDVDAALKELAY